MFFHNLTKNPFGLQSFSSAERPLCADTGVSRYPEAASGEKIFFEKPVGDS